MANLVCIQSSIVENVKAMEDRAILTQVQAYGDFLSGKFNDFQYNAVDSSMAIIIEECKKILEVVSVENDHYAIDFNYFSKAQQISVAMSALSRVA